MKSPAATISNVAQAVAKSLGKDDVYDVIGIRPGEKMFETLMSYEESINARDLGEFYVIPSEMNTLDYEAYFSKGKKPQPYLNGYNSNDTRLLTVDEIVKKLIEIGFVSE